MAYRLPDSLTTESDQRALKNLKKYYGKDGGAQFTGGYFDGWQPQDPDVVTAEDLLAVGFLSVVVPPMAAHAILGEQAQDFTRLLRDVGPDRDLVDEAEHIGPEWPARKLSNAFRRLDGIGPTIGGKLCARKRPRLIPVYDSVIAKVTDAYDGLWEPLRQELRADGGALHARLLRLREAAHIDPGVSALRIYDVVCWMEGKEKNFSPETQEEQLGEKLTDPGD